MTTASTPPPGPRQPLRWQGVVFAFAANLLLVSVADTIVALMPFGLNAELLATVAAPIIAGIATALYTKSRGGMHAFIGALISLPVIGLVVFRGAWPLAVFTTAFCTMAAAITELVLRRRA